MRVVVGDLHRKRVDQVQGEACTGVAPIGFEALTLPPLEAGRAPLHALFKAPAPDLPERPIVIVAHGLYDSKFSRYVVQTGTLLGDEGFGVLIPDMRWHGCLLGKDWLPTLGIEEGKDLLSWGSWLHQTHAGHPVGLLGYSLGALSVIHALGEPGAAAVFDAGGIAVSPPAALPRTAVGLDARPFMLDRGFDVFIARFFRSYLQRRLARLGLRPSEAPFSQLLTWLVGNGPLPAGMTVEQLLEKADPFACIRACRRPLLIVCSTNDPVFSEAASADLVRAAVGVENVRVVETPYGGHIGHAGVYPAWFATTVTRFFENAPSVR